jgi:mRNA-degrading endonuclease YafQ of YafQ-DinJ toxin-antitoxin module
MRIVRTDSFKRDYKRLPAHIQKRTEKALKLLVADFRYPSLRTKKMSGVFDPLGRDLFEASVTKSYRIIFTIVGDSFLVYRIGPHDVLEKPFG